MPELGRVRERSVGGENDIVLRQGSGSVDRAQLGRSILGLSRRARGIVREGAAKADFVPFQPRVSNPGGQPRGYEAAECEAQQADVGTKAAGSIAPGRFCHASVASREEFVNKVFDKLWGRC